MTSCKQGVEVLDSYRLDSYGLQYSLVYYLVLCIAATVYGIA